MKKDYTPKEAIEWNKHKNKIHPLGMALNEAFMEALQSTPPLPNVVWCIDLARFILGWELHAAGDKKPKLFVQNKLREKIEKDRGIIIRG